MPPRAAGLFLYGSLMTRLIWIYALLGWVAVACWPSSATLVDLWTTVDSSHGFVVAAAALWFVFRARREIAAAPARPSLLAFAALIVTALAWIVAWRAGIQALHLVLLPALMGLAITSVFGFAVALRLAVPLGLLYFGLPVWDWATAVLQTMTVHVTDGLLHLIHVPASVEGNFVRLPNGIFEIAAGCAGLHFFIVGLALAVIIGELDRFRLGRRVALVLIMAALTIVANWIRVFVIVMAGYETGMHHYLVKNHYGFGWAVFAVVFGIYLWAIRRWMVPGPVEIAEPSPDPIPSRPSFAIAMVIVAIPLAATTIVYLRERAERPLVSVRLPVGRSSWQGPSVPPPTTWLPDFKGEPSEARGLYRDGSGQVVDAFIVAYWIQRQGAELIGFDNSLLGHQQHAEETHRADSESGPFIETQIVDSHGGRALMWHSYQVGERRFVIPIRSQLWYGATSVLHEQPSTLVAFQSACASNCDDARRALAGFVSAMATGVRVAALTPLPYEKAPPIIAAEPLPQAAPGALAATLKQAVEHLQAGKNAEAEAAFRSALRSEGLTAQQRAVMQSGLVEALFGQRKLDQARTAYADLANAWPDAPVTRLLGARLTLAGGDVQSGTSDLQRLVVDSPNFVQARLLLAYTLMERGTLYQAEEQLKAVLQLAPKHAGAQAMLQEVRRRMNAPPPPPPDRNPVLLNNQAWQFLQAGDARAEDYARRAYELAPHSPQVADTYGWVLLRARKDVQRALSLLGPAAKAAPNDANIQYHYASALAAAGRKPEARTALQNVLTGTADFNERKDAEKLLESLAAEPR